MLVAGSLLTRAGPPATSSGDAPTNPGWRPVSYRDVVVDVPDAWGYDVAPGPDWCAHVGSDRVPREPYVAVSTPYDVVLAIGCRPTMPARYDVTHLELTDPGSRVAQESRERPGWRAVSRRVGSAVVTVWTDPRHAALARRVVDSARTVDVDPSGCAVRSPIQAGHFTPPAQPFRVEEVASVDAISVCQYDIAGGSDVPGLLASRRISGSAADDILDAVGAAPVGGGPDAPARCAEDVFGDTALVLRLHSGDEVRDLHVYMESCRGNGFDDGTTVRALTRAACRPLWALPVRLVSGHGQSFARCHG